MFISGVHLLVNTRTAALHGEIDIFADNSISGASSSLWQLASLEGAEDTQAGAPPLAGAGNLSILPRLCAGGRHTHTYVGGKLTHVDP